MSTQTLGDCLSLEAAETVTRYQLLYVNSSSKFAVATATSAPASHVATDNCESGSYLAGRSLAVQSSFKAVASAAITLGNPVYQNAAGKVSSVISGALVGFALQTVTTDGDILAIRPPTAGETIAFTTSLRAFTADATLSRAQSGLTCTNLGASGTVVLTLPQDAPIGTRFFVAVQAAQALRIDPGAAGAFYFSGAKQTDDKYLWADDEGESAIFVADGAGDWVVTHVTGTWTIEA